MDVSIIIVAWNVRKLLYDCLKSVYDQTKGVDFEVIYVDNASKDGSVEMVTKEFPEVKVIRNEENKGFIKANNQGIEVAQGRYVLLLNSDTIVLDNAIAKTVKFADEHPQAAVVGCKVLNPDRTLQRDCFMYPSPLNMLLAATHLYKIFPKSRFFGREEMTWWDYNDVREVETICGCFSLVRNEAIKQVGLMDEMYFMYGDDPDWCYRFKKNGWKIMFTPDGQIIHYGGQTTKHMASAFLLQLHGARLMFIKKHRDALSFRLACFFTALFFLLRVPYWAIVAVLNRSERKRAAATAWTYLKGARCCLVRWEDLLMNKGAVTTRATKEIARETWSDS
jgi:hypothetical protein